MSKEREKNSIVYRNASNDNAIEREIVKKETDENRDGHTNEKTKQKKIERKRNEKEPKK